MYLTQGLRRCAERNPERLALAGGGRQWSWREFNDRVARLAGGLVAMGLRPNDRVAILSHNGPEYFEFSYGVPWAGGVIVPLNNKLTAADLVYILNHSGTRFLLADEDFRALIEDFSGQLESVEKTLYFAPGQDDSPYENLIASVSPLDDQLRGYEDMAGVFFTHRAPRRGRDPGQQHQAHGGVADAGRHCEFVGGVRDLRARDPDDDGRDGEQRPVDRRRVRAEVERCHGVQRRLPR